jgi:hypothetical protein
LNVLKPHLRVTIQTLLRNGTSQREIGRLTGVDRKTIRRYGQEILGPPANSPGVATGISDTSSCSGCSADGFTFRRRLGYSSNSLKAYA